MSNLIYGLTDVDMYSHAEIRVLIRHAQQGNDRARELIIKSNLKYVVFVAKEYLHKSSLEIEDLIGEGNLGLIAAINRFNVNAENQFLSYATHWIRCYIMKAIDNAHLIRTPSNVAVAARHAAYLSNGVRLTQEEIEKLPITGMNKSLAERVYIALCQNPSSLDTKIDDGDGNSVSLSDILGIDDENFRTVENQAIMHEIYRFMESLTYHEVYILTNTLLQDTPMSLQEIANYLGMNYDKVKCIRGQVVAKLRNSKSIKSLLDS